MPECVVIAGVTLAAERLRRLREGALVVGADLAPLRIAGPKALDCLQGLLTNDLIKPGDNSVTYGALLTPKGMLVVDAWVVRRPAEFIWLTPTACLAATLGIFRKSLPPRLAAVTDQSETHAVVALYGAQSIAMLEQAGIGPGPEAGRVAEHSFGGWPLVVLRPAVAPFTALVIIGRAEADALVQHLIRSGFGAGDSDDAEAARILAGWPALQYEIDDKTLPQEVRYDDLGAVSYSKGCYVGQETVARLHFRGHANRELRGLVWQNGGPVDSTVLRTDGKPAGEISSLLHLPDRTLGLIKIRREVLEQGTTELDAGGRPARLVALPFSAADLSG
jgi:folate-binding protein YgfZ